MVVSKFVVNRWLLQGDYPQMTQMAADKKGKKFTWPTRMCTRSPNADRAALGQIHFPICGHL
jgi:hypothetical protein